MTRVLVTGGAGFVGSHVVDRLVDRGYDVLVLDALLEDVHDGRPEYLNGGAEYVWGDLRDRELLADCLSRADVVSHQASTVGVGQSMYQIERYVENNALGTARLLDVVVDSDLDLERVVVASSRAVYGEGAYRCPRCERRRYPDARPAARMEAGDWEQRCGECGARLDPAPTPERAPRRGNSVYAITKRSQEDLCLAAGREHGVPTVALRYFNVFGPRQAPRNTYTGVCSIFASRIENGEPPPVFEDGAQSRDFVHVSDVARANVAAIERSAGAGEAINVGTGVGTSIRELAEALLEAYGRSDLEPEVTGDFRNGDIRHSVADTDRAEALLGFEPETDLRSGLRGFVDWMRDREGGGEGDFRRALANLEERDIV